MLDSVFSFIGAIIVSLIVGAISATIIIIIYNYIMKAHIGIESKNVLILTIIIACLYMGYISIREYWGTDTIGSIFEKYNFTSQYYVNLFPDIYSIKNYRVKADIVASYIDYVYEDEDGNNKHGKQRVYWIKKAYFNNGGYITFNNAIENEHEGLVLNTKIHIKDDNDTSWYIELTEEKVCK